MSTRRFEAKPVLEGLLAKFMDSAMRRTCVFKRKGDTYLFENAFCWKMQDTVFKESLKLINARERMRNLLVVNPLEWPSFKIPLQVSIAIDAMPRLEVAFDTEEKLLSAFNDSLKQLGIAYHHGLQEVGEFVYVENHGVFYIPPENELVDAACMSLLGSVYVDEKQNNATSLLWSRALKNAAKLYKSHSADEKLGGLTAVILAYTGGERRVSIDFGAVVAFVVKHKLVSILKQQDYENDLKVYTEFGAKHPRAPAPSASPFSLNNTPSVTALPGDSSYTNLFFESILPNRPHSLNRSQSWNVTVPQAAPPTTTRVRYETVDDDMDASSATGMAPAVFSNSFMDYAPTDTYKPFIVRDLNPKKVWSVVGTAPRVIPQPPERKYKDLYECFRDWDDLFKKITKFIEGEFDKRTHPPLFVLYDAIMQRFSVESPYGQDNDALTRQLKTAYMLRLLEELKRIANEKKKKGTGVDGATSPLGSPRLTTVSNHGSETDDEY